MKITTILFHIFPLICYFIQKSIELIKKCTTKMPRLNLHVECKSKIYKKINPAEFKFLHTREHMSREADMKRHQQEMLN